LSPKEEPIFEYSEIGWEGNPDELALFILVGGCQCAALDEVMPLLDDKVNRVGISFRGHKSLKSAL
jgi:hypothetical protein